MSIAVLRVHMQSRQHSVCVVTRWHLCADLLWWFDFGFSNTRGLSTIGHKSLRQQPRCSSKRWLTNFMTRPALCSSPVRRMWTSVMKFTLRRVCNLSCGVANTVGVVGWSGGAAHAGMGDGTVEDGSGSVVLASSSNDSGHGSGGGNGSGGNGSGSGNGSGGGSGSGGNGSGSGSGSGSCSGGNGRGSGSDASSQTPTRSTTTASLAAGTAARGSQPGRVNPATSNS